MPSCIAAVYPHSITVEVAEGVTKGRNPQGVYSRHKADSRHALQVDSNRRKFATGAIACHEIHPCGRIIKYLKAMSADARYDVRSIDFPALALQVITRSVWAYAMAT